MLVTCLNLATSMNLPCYSLGPHWDVIHQITLTKHLINSFMTHQHVLAHQDLIHPWCNLSIPEKLNATANWLASTVLEIAISIPVPPLLLASQAQMVIQGNASL